MTSVEPFGCGAGVDPADLEFVSQISRFVERQNAAIGAGPILPNVKADEIRAFLRSQYDFSHPLSLEKIIADVESMLRNWQVQVTHPRYLGLFNPSVSLASVIADTLAAVYNSQLATWRTSPGPNEIERHTLSWLAEKFGLPADAFATFTTGGTEANLSAVIVALTHAFPDYAESGLRALESSPVIYVSGEAHLSFTRIAHLTGLGRRQLRIVATDSEYRMDPADLQRQIRKDRNDGLTPTMAVGTCGATATGVIDPLPDLQQICAQEGLWFHVDAAWGGAAAISPSLRHHLAGIETADSITCDAHKWFSVPMGAGMFFCRHTEAVAESFHARNSFMPGQTAGDVFDPYTMSMQWSRRFAGLKLFLALAHKGEGGYAEMIEHQTAMGNVLRRLLRDSGWKIMNATPLPLVCFTRDGLDTGEFLAELHRHQIAWMSEVRLGGGTPALRACITSFKTNESDLEWIVEQMNRLIPAPRF